MSEVGDVIAWGAELSTEYTSFIVLPQSGMVGLSYGEKAIEPQPAIGQRLEGRTAQTTASQGVSGSTKHFNDSLVADPYLA